MRDGISFLLLVGSVSLPLAGCEKEEDERVTLGLELQSSYRDAFCAVASDSACSTDDSTCAFQPYDSMEACESVVNVSFANCSNLWVPLADAEAEVRTCIQALESFTCGAEGLCDEGGYSVFPLPECEVIVDLQTLWCEPPDTF